STGLSASVVVSTYDDRRWDDLVSCVASIRNQSVVPSELIVVVDHNPGLLSRARRAFAYAMVLANGGPRGRAAARHGRISAASGDVMAFMGDDARAEPEWLEWLLSCFADANTVGAGGAIEPLWERKRPRWVPPELYWVYGCSYAGLPTELAPVRNPIG